MSPFRTLRNCGSSSSCVARSQPPIGVYSATLARRYAETLAGLGFLGFGIEQTAAAEWGYDLNRAVADVAAGNWWTAVFPGLAIVLSVLGITLVALAVRWGLTALLGAMPGVTAEWGGEALAPPRLHPVLGFLAVAAPFGAVYFGLAAALGVPEAGAVLRKVGRKLRLVR